MERYKPFYNQPKDARGGSLQTLTPDEGVMDELLLPTQTELPGTVEEIIYSVGERGNDVMDVFRWFKDDGFGENWVLGDERRLAKDLVDFSQGTPTDFPIWNCIGFEWIKDPKGGFPFCNITNNLDAAITWYFKDKIQEMSEMLSFIENPTISILVPSNEAFDGRVWRYKQPLEEREKVINETVEGLNERFGTLLLPENTTVQAVRWDDFLTNLNAEKTPAEYSIEGEKRVKESRNFAKIVKEATKSGRKYLERNGITNVTNGDLLAKRQIEYYGVYAGEGVFYEELKKRGRNVIVTNFEEMRVSQMAFLGSNGATSFVTPIKWQRMQEFYQWEAQQIAKRK
jgi:hypothetical protein